MIWLRKILAMLLDTKKVKAMRQEQSDLRGMVVMAKADEAIEVNNLRYTLERARVESKYRPSALASSMGWKPYG